MRIRIDLKILIFLIVFYITGQINIYLTIFLFCTIHELGHIVTGMLLKMKPERIEVMPYGLSVAFEIQPEDINKKIKKGTMLELKNIVVSIAGPLTSLILAIMFVYIKLPMINQMKAIYSNILIFLFNLTPVYPLDGGRIIRGILHIKYGNIISKKITNEVSNISMLFITLTYSIAVYYFKNIAYFFICLVLWMITIEENKKFKRDMRIYQNLKNE